MASASAEPYVYGFMAGGHVQRILYAELSSALYAALVDAGERRNKPLGIRWGRRRLYSRADLLTLHELHAAQLASRDHWPIIQALQLLDSTWP